MAVERDILLLRFDAPLMSFGGPVVDYRGVIDPFPGRSLLAGLCANALGYDHRDHELTERLQRRLRVASRADAPGRRLRDYHTVDLGQPHMLAKSVGWTTSGVVEDRRGGSASAGTAIRLRDYHADALYTVAVCLADEGERPTLAEVAGALRTPARPLFLGRKTCLPGAPLFLAVVRATSPMAALMSWPRVVNDRRVSKQRQPLSAWWAEEDGEAPVSCATSRELPVSDVRDWQNQIHTGQRVIRHGLIDPPEGKNGT